LASEKIVLSFSLLEYWATSKESERFQLPVWNRGLRFSALRLWCLTIQGPGNCRCPRRDSIQPPPDYKSRALPLQPACSAYCYSFYYYYYCCCCYHHHHH
jgi:hypothetical protein